MKRSFRVIATFMLVLVALSIGNHWRHPHTCDDCFARYGFPFTAGNSGGMAGGSEIYWFGWLGNFAVMLGLIIGIAALWEWLGKKPLRQK